MPTASRGAALVGFTGDADFNRYLRGKAIKVGMRLNDFGLWKRPTNWKPSQDRERKEDDENWELIPTETEQDVFDELNEGWVDPEKRNFNNLQGRNRKRSDS
jgi:DNA polymerase beta